MSEDINDEVVNEEASTTSEETVIETPEVEEPKADGAFVETDNANVQSRFNKITAQRKSAESERDALQARLDQIESDKLQAIINKPAPTEEQHDYDQEATQAAQAAHWQAVGQAQGAQQAAAQMAQQQQANAQAQLNQAYSDKVVKFAEKTPDFVESVSALSGLNQQVMTHIQQLDNAPEVAYELSKNMQLAQQLNNAANSGDALTAGSILAQVQGAIKSAPKDKKITSAGGVIGSPIQGGVTPDNPDKQYKHIGGATFE